VREGIRAACTAARTKLEFYYAQTPKEIDEAFARIRAERPGALLVSSDSFIHQQRRQVAERAVATGLPSIGHHVGYADAGGLASYGSNPDESFRLAAGYIDKVLKGARPQDLPVEQPTRLQLVINGRTAKALGLKIPPELLLMADRVIE
jgi:putative ABC transport system substrate-binding protein